MILSHRHYPLHSAVTVLQFEPSCFVRISTAKEGIFKGSSTMLSVLPHALAGAREGAAFGKIMWADALRAPDRQKAHDNFAAELDTWLTMFEGKGEISAIQLAMGLDLVGEKWRRSGLLKELVNLLRG